MSFRIQRINSEIQKSLSDIISNRVKDPRVKCMVSVLDVNTAKDLKTAKVRISIYGDENDTKDTLDGIKASAGFIKTELAKDFKEIRTVPTITFILDNSASYGQKIDEILLKLKSEEKDNDKNKD